MTERELFNLKDFAVGHRQHGLVRWEGITDVRALDLDQIVAFENGKIEVYDDGIEDKPAQGTLLNKHAVIKLHEIWSPEVKDEEEEPLTEDQRREYQREWGKAL